MFVRNQPPMIYSLTTTGRAYPRSGLLLVLQGSACSAEPIGNREIPARHDMDVADVHLESLLSKIDRIAH